jgi:hypothetical protein
MTYRKGEFDLRVLPLVLLLVCGTEQALRGQAASKWAANLGVGINQPVGRTADFVDFTGTLSAGVGYRFREGQTLLAQYYATGLPFSRAPLTELSILTPTSTLYSLTANYKFDLTRSRNLRPYLIAGGGWYRRVTTITRPAAVGNILCSEWLGWWGYGCELGTVPLDKVVAASTADAFGVNAGVGLSGRIWKAGPRWYLEARYHHAPHTGVSTQTLPITIGLTW